MEQKSYPIKEVTEITGYSARQLHYLIKQGKIKAEKVGWIWTIPEAEVARLQSGDLKEQDEGGDPKVPLKDLAAEFEVDPKELRRVLREEKIPRPGAYWEWPEDSAELEGIKKMLESMYGSSKPQSNVVEFLTSEDTEESSDTFH